MQMFKPSCRYLLVIYVLFFSSLFGAVHPAHGEILYQVQWPDRELWLLGTIHIAAQSSTELTTKAKNAILKSDRLWLEMTNDELKRSSDLLFKQGLHDYPYLKEQLPTELWNELAALIARLGLAPTVVQRMEPWLVEYIVMVLWLRREGFDSQKGIDYQVMRFAATNELQVHGLETAEEQIKALSQARENMPAAEYISEVLLQLNTLTDDLIKLEESWQKGDLAQLWQQVTQDLPVYTQHVLLVERNQQWLRKIRAELNADEQHFIAVGAAHLAGEQGLLALFQRSGAQITQH